MFVVQMFKSPRAPRSYFYVCKKYFWMTGWLRVAWLAVLVCLSRFCCVASEAKKKSDCLSLCLHDCERFLCVQEIFLDDWMTAGRLTGYSCLSQQILLSCLSLCMDDCISILSVLHFRWLCFWWLCLWWLCFWWQYFFASEIKVLVKQKCMVCGFLSVQSVLMCGMQSGCCIGLKTATFKLHALCVVYKCSQNVDLQKKDRSGQTSESVPDVLQLRCNDGSLCPVWSTSSLVFHAVHQKVHPSSGNI